jgi:hypothetical protein
VSATAGPQAIADLPGPVSARARGDWWHRRRRAKATLGRLELPDRFAAWAAHELSASIGLPPAPVEVTPADPNADATALGEMGERVVAAGKRELQAGGQADGPSLLRGSAP